MSLQFRKTVSAGPFRFNFSTGGVGMSVGVKGLRIGTGPRGHYVQARAGGFYYRSSIGGPQARRRSSPVPRGHVPPVAAALGDGMIAVTSGDVLAMRDGAFSDLLDELNEKHRQTRLSLVFGVAGFAVTALAVAIVGPSAVIVAALWLIAWAVGAWMDSYKRVAVLFYEVDGLAAKRFEQVCAAFDGLKSCSAAWHVRAGKAVQDLTTWKRQAGASHLVQRTPAALQYSLPKVLRCNVTPPVLKVGSRTIYLLPDAALIEDASGFGAVGYDALQIAHQPSNFIETGGVPRDAEVSHHTWEHPNKSGGPDRRFRSNRRLPVCRYEAMHLRSASGINELLEFSRVGLVSALATAIRSMPKNAGIDRMRSLPDIEGAA